MTVIHCEVPGLKDQFDKKNETINSLVENTKFSSCSYPQSFRHLRVAHGLVDDDSLDQHGVLHASADLTLDLDQLEVHVTLLQVGY